MKRWQRFPTEEDLEAVMGRRGWWLWEVYCGFLETATWTVPRGWTVDGWCAAVTRVVWYYYVDQRPFALDDEQEGRWFIRAAEKAWYSRSRRFRRYRALALRGLCPKDYRRQRLRQRERQIFLLLVLLLGLALLF